MSLTQENVKKIAKLARIEMPVGRLEVMTKEINSIMGWIEQLKEVNVDGITPMAGVGHNTLRLRRDEVTDGNCTDDVLRNAPKKAFNCYVVPKMVDQG